VARPYVDVVDDWGQRLLSVFYEQFKGAPNLTALARDVCGPQFQALEDAAQALLTLTSIDDSEGTQLDRLGVLLGQPRAGLDDATYRLALKARVKVNRSSGTVEDIYAFLSALAPGTRFQYVRGFPEPAETPGQASFQVTALTPISRAQGEVGAELLQDAKMAGVRAYLAWQEQADSQTFYTALATTVATASLAGDTSLTLVDTTPLGPVGAAGTMRLDYGLSTDESTTYTVTSATVVSCPALAHAHDVGASVELVGDPGQGFALAAGLSSAAAPTDATLVLQETSGFPSAGSVVVDPGMPNEEILSYTSISGGTTLNLSGTVVNTHDAGAAVLVVSSNDGGALANAE
jgi:hypothetical protein